MRVLLYLLALAFSCFFKYGYCVYDDFKSNEEAMDLVKKYHDGQNTEITSVKDLYDKLKEKNVFGKSITTLTRYVTKIQKEKEAIEAKKYLAGAHQNLLKRQHEVALQSMPGLHATAYLPNQSQSTAWTGASNQSSQFQGQQPNSSRFYNPTQQQQTSNFGTNQSQSTRRTNTINFSHPSSQFQGQQPNSSRFYNPTQQQQTSNFGTNQSQSTRRTNAINFEGPSRSNNADKELDLTLSLGGNSKKNKGKSKYFG
uniref:Uncharacterized protein n=2 Tax=Globodera rostochiensis TaxID=31243 RepID=A0A914I2C7_GLORO